MQTIDQLIQASCLRHTGNTALCSKQNDSWKPISYARLWESVEKLAAGLRDLDIEAGAHIALMAPSSPRWVTAFLSVLRAECVAVPVDKELKGREVRHILNNSDAEAIFVAQPYLETLLEIIDDLPTLKKVIVIDTPLAELVEQDDVAESVNRLAILWKELVKGQNLPAELSQQIEEAAIDAHNALNKSRSEERNKQKNTKKSFLAETEITRNRLLKEKRLFAYKDIFNPVALPAANNKADKAAVILYTSGTTGQSKGAMLSHRNIVSNLDAITLRFELDSSMSTLSFLPINHVFELVCGVLLPLSLGGRINFAESIKKLGVNLGEIKPTFLLAVPAVYRLLLDRISKNIESKAASRLLYRLPLTRSIVANKVRQTFGTQTKFVSGGAALDPEISNGFKALGIKILQGYGITETSPVISAESFETVTAGTVGLPLQGVEIKIKDANAEGEGEIVVKGPNVMLGYYKNDKATAEVLRDGWYHTGDLGRVDQQKALTICGRVKNLIVTPNGKNVYPEEIENQLLKSPFIAEIMVYGHKLSATAEEVYAVVFPDEEALFELARERGNSNPFTAAEIEELIRKEVLSYGKDLADYKRVKKFTLREDEFPKTTTRKIKRYIVEPEITTNRS